MVLGQVGPPLFKPKQRFSQFRLYFFARLFLYLSIKMQKNETNTRPKRIKKWEKSLLSSTVKSPKFDLMG